MLKLDYEMFYENISMFDEQIIMIRIDVNGIVLNVSKAFCEISGYCKNELINNKYIIPNDEISNKEYETLCTTIKNGKTWNSEVKNLKKDSSFYWTQDIGKGKLDSNNNLIYFDIIKKDITYKKELLLQKKILIQQEKAANIGNMIELIAHQWKQPIQTISLIIQKLTVDTMLDIEITKKVVDGIVSDISSQLIYMNNTIDDFKDFYSIAKEQEYINMQELINKVYTILSPVLKINSIELVLDIVSDKQIKIFINDIVQTFVNIITNACDAMIKNKIKNKKINISCYDDNEYLIIQIEDNGKGIEDKIINDVFKAYISSKINGTGLGLYICKSIIEDYNNGSITAKNSKEGAVFQISLPL